MVKLNNHLVCVCVCVWRKWSHRLYAQENHISDYLIDAEADGNATSTCGETEATTTTTPAAAAQVQPNVFMKYQQKYVKGRAARASSTLDFNEAFCFN